jgi:hypothetical protein
MTPRKKWPKEADDLRLDAMAKAHRITRLTSQVAQSVSDPRVLLTLKEISDAAHEIRFDLQIARDTNTVRD